MEHLLANSGLQFITQEIELTPSDQYLLPNGKPLRYSFLDKVEEDPVFGDKETFFDFVCPDAEGRLYIQLDELIKQNDNALVKLPNGSLLIDDNGLPVVREDMDPMFFMTFPSSCKEVYSINNLESFKVNKSKQSNEKVSAFHLLLDKWLPMPMFAREVDGNNTFYPTGWCRVKIMQLTSDPSGRATFRLIWAFDTNLSNDDLSLERPTFYETDPESKEYSLCNRADVLFRFMFTDNNDANAEKASRKCSNVTEYLASILGIDLLETKPQQFKFVAFYIYLINLLRLAASPEVTLHNKMTNASDIPVDMVLDIGNSRTCGVLFEKGDFTTGKMLEIRNLSRPWLTYDSSFDMRVVFRRADFGNDIITQDENLFNWKSLLRVGVEAQELIYNSLEQVGLSQKTTNYSSPKRYLWDNKTFKGKWEFLVSKNDPLNVQVSDSVYIRGLSKLFDEKGDFTGAGSPQYGQDCKYSRSSLMTFVFLEIFQQALMQVNSPKYRKAHGNIDCRRYLRNLIITAPTAMPNIEQQKLRQCAIDAYSALKTICPSVPDIKIVPEPDSIDCREDYDERRVKSWTYDEATASQFVYLYAEIAKKYSGDVDRFMDARGHVRKDLADKGYDKKALTVASIDIGAGTTDMMICSYEIAGKGHSILKPIPIFWDSFYLAGDDILKNIILRVLIEGREDDDVTVGSFYSVLEARMLKMTNDELSALKSVNKAPAFRLLMDEILNSVDSFDRSEKIKRYADNLIKDYFGSDAAAMNFNDRRCRADFNIQVSVPIAQMMLDLLRLNRPSKVYKFNEIFTTNKPATYLLNHFSDHFGFRLEEMEWRFNPAEIAAQVQSTMEPLMKQLSIILHAYDIDVLILAGRPSSLNSISNLFIKYYPVSPDRLIRLNDYQVGSWYPLANPDGFFYDQKSVVAVGAMVGYLASSEAGFKGMKLDFEELVKTMKSTANYIGVYKSERYQVKTTLLSPKKGNASFVASEFPVFLGCKQLDAPIYQARPIFAIYNNSSHSPLTIQLNRDYSENREAVEIEEVLDAQGEKVDGSLIELVQQSITDERFWLDDGVFKFL